MNDRVEDPMHPDFARWYSVVELDGKAERRRARWEGVRMLMERADFPLVEALIRLAFKTRQLPTAPSVQLMRDVFREADETFEMQGNDREMQVLASACLAALMADSTEIASHTALAVTTTCLAGARRADLPMDLGMIAEDALLRLADANRQRPDLEAYREGKISKFDFENAAAKAREAPNGEGFAQALTLVAESVRAALSYTANRQASAIQAIDDFMQIQDEELQMLWWLIGQRSFDYDCPFDAVPPDAQPLVLATELANATKVLPGPPSVKALLSRSGLKEKKKITIPAAVNAAKTEWLRKLLEESDPSPVTMPLHAAIKRQLETGGGDAWVAGWAATTDIGASCLLPVLTLGTLFYRERLLHCFI